MSTPILVALFVVAFLIGGIVGVLLLAWLAAEAGPFR